VVVIVINIHIFAAKKNRKSLVVGETHFHMYIHNPYIYILYYMYNDCNVA
jgi:hypothetical protein